MNESNVKRRIWIRNILIIFLTVLLLLTFFSQTILNYSLPIVSVRYPSWGTIASRVNVTGSVRANRSYDVTIEQTRQIESVFVYVGQRVAKGDVLFTLVDGGSEELAQAEKLLSELKIQLIQKEASDPSTLPSEAEARILQLEIDLDDAKFALDDARDNLALLEKQYNALLAEKGKKPTLIDIQAAKATVEIEKNSIEDLEKQIERLRGKQGQTGGSGYYTDAELKALIAESEAALLKAEKAAADALSAKEAAEWMIEQNKALLKAAEEALTAANAKVSEYEATMPGGSVTTESLEREEAAIHALKAEKAEAETLKETLRATYAPYEDQANLLERYNLVKAEYEAKLSQFFTVADERAAAISAFSQSEHDAAKRAYTDAETALAADPTNEALKQARDVAWAAYRPYEAEFLNIKALTEEYNELQSEKDALKDTLDGIPYDKNVHDAAKEAYDDAVLAAGGKTVDALTAEITRLTAAIEAAEKAYEANVEKHEAGLSANTVLAGLRDKRDKAKKQVDMLTSFGKAYEDSLTDATAALTKAQAQLAEAKAEYERADGYLTYESLADEIKEKTELKEAAEERLAKAEATIAAGSAESEEALDADIKAKGREVDTAKKRVSAAERTVTDTENKLAQARRDKQIELETGKLEKQQYELELSQLKTQLQKQEKEVERLRKMSTDGTVVAPAAGVIESLPYSIGMTAPANTPVATITLAEAGYTMECTVSAKEAAQIRVGDVGEILYYYWGEVPTAKVVNIQSAQGSMGQSRTVTLEITGQVEAGVNLTVALGSKNQSYDAVVPSSAIREDQNGKFVLIVTSKSTPLGNRYKAKRVDVEVLASDTVNSAISGDVLGQYVITHAEVPISSGDAVRLSEE